MKHSKTCPKCGGTKIFEVTGGRMMDNGIPVGLGFIPVDRYVCASCGYSEEWVREGRMDELASFY